MPTNSNLSKLSRTVFQKFIGFRTANPNSLLATMPLAFTYAIPRFTPGTGLSSDFEKLICASLRATTPSFFLLDDKSPPVFVPYSGFEELFHSIEPASDGQYKVQLVSQDGSRELYISRKGRFNVEGYVGFDFLEKNLKSQNLRKANRFSHSQVQTLLASIGHLKGYDIFLPKNDIGKLDWSITKKFNLLQEIPKGFDDIYPVLSEIDVIWVASGRNAIEGLYEVEHSTPVYSGLLRFNDMILTEPKISRFSIVSNDSRRDLFSRQINRPTFKKSGLSELVSFMEYGNVLDWHTRLIAKGKN